MSEENSLTLALTSTLKIRGDINGIGGNMMSNIYEQVVKLLDQGKDFVLATIISQKGSAPRSIGTSFIVLEDGSFVGTIGGGRLEVEVINAARSAAKEGTMQLLHFDLMGKDASSTDMLCGGNVDVLLEPIPPRSKGIRELFQEASLLCQRGEGAILATVVEPGLKSTDHTARAIITAKGKKIGSLKGDPELEARIIEAWRKGRHGPALLEFEPGPVRVFLQPLEPEDLLFLFGAGHISTFLVPLARLVGFRVVVVDDREEFATRERFPQADEVKVLDLKGALDQLPITPSTYIVIVTRGHIYDREILRQALGHDCAYIGMIGSRRKKAIIFESFMKEGIPRERLETVHTPIGLDIGAETPEEIAVSIVAELIQVRAQMRGSFHWTR